MQFYIINTLYDIIIYYILSYNNNFLFLSTYEISEYIILIIYVIEKLFFYKIIKHALNILYN